MMSRSQSQSSSNAGQTGASFGFNIQPPPALDPHADAAAWKRWKTLFEACATISKLSERSEEERAATIVAIMGMEAIDLYHSLPFVAEALTPPAIRYTHQPSPYARTALMSHTHTTFPHKSSYNFPFLVSPSFVIKKKLAARWKASRHESHTVVVCVRLTLSLD